MTPDEVDQIARGRHERPNGASDETMLAALSTPDAAMGCEAGGRVMAQGLDNGDGDNVCNGILQSGEVDARTVFCSTLDFDRVTDVNGGTNNSYPGFYLEVRDDTLYFDSDDGIHGRELWAYGIENGTTWMVADINPDSGGAIPVTSAKPSSATASTSGPPRRITTSKCGPTTRSPASPSA